VGYSADGKTKANELSLPLCLGEKGAVRRVVDGQRWLVFMLCFGVACPVPSSMSDNFSVVQSLCGCRFSLSCINIYTTPFGANILLFWQNPCIFYIKAIHYYYLPLFYMGNV